jgi:hypothetical protein
MGTTETLLIVAGVAVAGYLAYRAMNPPPPAYTPDPRVQIAGAADAGQQERMAVYGTLGDLFGAVGSIAGAVAAGQHGTSPAETPSPHGDTGGSSVRYTGTSTGGGGLKDPALLSARVG